MQPSGSGLDANKAVRKTLFAPTPLPHQTFPSLLPKRARRRPYVYGGYVDFTQQDGRHWDFQQNRGLGEHRQRNGCTWSILKYSVRKMNPIRVLGNKKGFLKQAKDGLRDYRQKCHLNWWIVNFKKKKVAGSPKDWASWQCCTVCR